MTYYEVDNILATIDVVKKGVVCYSDFQMPAIDAVGIISDLDKCYKIIRKFDEKGRMGITLEELEKGL
jgi:hypothetical protein